jgi:hypothetical protein
MEWLDTGGGSGHAGARREKAQNFRNNESFTLGGNADACMKG